MPSPASSTAHPDPDRPLRPRKLTQKACETDNVALISQVISIAASPNSRETIQEVFDQAVWESIYQNATNVLTYILEQGASVPSHSQLRLKDPSKKTLEILLAHGWDINARRIREHPFLWEVVGDGDLVSWCLEHGATTVPKNLGLTNDERQNDEYGCTPLLERAAPRSTVATFELLRSKGAQQGRRMLHFAASAAIKIDDEKDSQSQKMSDKERAKLHSEKMAMVIHLVETLGIDPNVLDQPVGWSLGNHWGTPLCYVALEANPNWDCTEVVQYLLKKGANPTLIIEPAGWDAIKLAKRNKNQRFLDIVENWKM